MWVEKKEVKNIVEFANLFLARYSIKYSEEDQTVYFPFNFKELLEEVMQRNNDGISYKEYNIFDENNLFKSKEFIKCLCKSTIKLAWNDQLRYDAEKHMLYTLIVIAKAKEYSAKFYASDTSKVDKVVDEFYELKTLEEKRKKLLLQ